MTAVTWDTGKALTQATANPSTITAMTVKNPNSRSWPPARIGLAAIAVVVIAGWLIGSVGVWL